MRRICAPLTAFLGYEAGRDFIGRSVGSSVASVDSRFDMSGGDQLPVIGCTSVGRRAVMAVGGGGEGMLSG